MAAGMKFPPQIDKATGRFLMADELESVKDSIYLILMTQKTERFTRPDYGSNMLSYTFTDTNPTTLHMLERNVKETILSQEPRVADVEVQTRVSDKEASLYIEIGYQLAQSTAKGTLTLPLPL